MQHNVTHLWWCPPSYIKLPFLLKSEGLILAPQHLHQLSKNTQQPLRQKLYTGRAWGVHENDWMLMSCRYPGVGKDSCTTEDAQAKGEL